MHTSFFYAALMLVAGLGIPIMAALNARLGTSLQSPTLAAAILFLVALLLVLSYLIVTQGVPKSIYESSIPWYFYGGGFFVVFYVLTITWVVPRFGVSNAVAFVLLGQLIAMSSIDHFGLFGLMQTPVSKQRLLGLVFMAIGVFLVLSRSSSR